MATHKIESFDFVNDEEFKRKRKLLYYTVYITFPLTGMYTVLFYYNEVFIDSYIQFGCFLGFLFLLILLKKGVSTIIVSWIYITLAAISIYASIYYTGGLYSVGLGWLVSHAPVALLIGTRKHGFAAAISDTVFLVTLSIMHQTGYEFPPTVAEFTSTLSNIFSGLFGLFGLMFLVSLVFENGKNSALRKLAEQNRIIDEERERSDTLLLNIMPEEVAKELKLEGKTSAKKYEHATIMFCDFVAFSKIAESMPPEELVVLLDEYFRKFDDIMGKYGIEKIKTIGDAYLAVSGIPDKQSHSPQNTVLAAIEMLDFVKSKLSSHSHFNIRIGINTGPVVAGVVGRAKFAYDIWGDAVNVAARMEQNSEANGINISETTFDEVKESVKCIYRGGIEAKNRGVLKMYSVDVS